MVLTTQVDIRPAEASDIEAIQQFAHAVVPAAYAEFAPGMGDKLVADWWNADQLRDCIDNTATLIAVGGDSVVGLAQLDAREPEPVLWKLYTAADQRGTGLGSALLAAVIAALPERPASILTEYLADNTAAAAWYERRGFVVTAREHYPGEPESVWARLALPSMD